LFPIVKYRCIFAAVKERFEQILLQARSIFMRYGLKSVTMDDVCREMGMSKKTLYQFVCDKSDLVKRTIELEIKNDQEQVELILAKKLNAIDELFEISALISEKLKYIHPSVIFDMQKYYPEAYTIMSNYRSEYIVRTIINNTNRGREQGVFHDDFNVMVISKFYSLKMEMMIDPSFISENNSLPDIFFEHLKYHIRGIANQNGLQLLEKKLNLLKP
jgi:AcrR family transcriptional regulator